MLSIDAVANLSLSSSTTLFWNDPQLLELCSEEMISWIKNYSGIFRLLKANTDVIWKEALKITNKQKHHANLLQRGKKKTSERKQQQSHWAYTCHGASVSTQSRPSSTAVPMAEPGTAWTLQWGICMEAAPREPHC